MSVGKKKVKKIIEEIGFLFETYCLIISHKNKWHKAKHQCELLNYDTSVLYETYI